MTLAQRWAGLTPEQLDAASADLRNAATVLDHAGWHAGSMVAYTTGGCCMLGAIELSTFRHLVTIPQPGGTHFRASGKAECGFYGTGWTRANNATLAASLVMPADACDMCDPAMWTPEDRAAWLVTHYNDEHCDGGDEAAKLLVLAAERAEAAALVRRVRNLQPA